MDLVIFYELIDHVLRISRILGQPRGNALIIGFGGAGKRTVAHLAALAHDF